MPVKKSCESFLRNGHHIYYTEEWIVDNEKNKVNGSLKITSVSVDISEVKKNEFRELWHQLDITPEKNTFSGVLKDGLSHYFRGKWHEKHRDPEEDHWSWKSVKTFFWVISRPIVYLLTGIEYCLLLSMPKGDEIQEREEQIEKRMQAIQSCISPFTYLELLINNHNNYPDLNELLTRVERCHSEVLEKLRSEKEGASKSIQEVRRLSFKKLEEEKILFVEYIKALQKTKPLPVSVLKQLLCVQDGAILSAGDIPSLGAFIAKQMRCIVAGGIDEVYHLTGVGPFRFKKTVHPAIAALSDAESWLKRKTSAMRGAHDINSWTPIPLDLLQSINPFFDQNSLPESKESEKNTVNAISLSPYVASLNDIEKVDEIISYLTGAGIASQRRGWSVIWRTIGAVILESIPLVLHVVALIVAFLCSSIYFVVLSVVNVSTWLASRMASVVNVSFSPYQMNAWYANTLCEWATKMHRFFSPMGALRKWSREVYIEAIPSSTENDEKYKNFLTTLSKGSEHFLAESNAAEVGAESYVNGLLTLCSPSNVVGVLSDLFERIGEFFKDGWSSAEMMGFYRSTPETRKAVFREHQENIDRIWAINNPEPIEAKEDASENKMPLLWNTATPWEPNVSSSIVDVMATIVCGTADLVIDPLFRHDAGLATAAFMFSSVSLAVLTVPALGINPTITWITTGPASWLSEHITGKIVLSNGLSNLTGKIVSDGALSKVVACSLQWKASVLIGETVKMVSKGELLEAIEKVGLADIDKTVLQVSGVIALGSAFGLLHYLPPIPASFQDCLTDLPWHPSWLDYLANVELPMPVRSYLSFSEKVLFFPATFINTLAEETFVCNHGTFPLNAIELGGFGLQIGLMGNALLVGGSSRRTFAPGSVTVSYGEGLSRKTYSIGEPSAEKLRVISAKVDLQEAMLCIWRMHKKNYSGFKSKTERKIFFDQLSDIFYRYNACVSIENQVDPEAVLHDFKNKYIETASVGLLRVLVIPFSILIWRPLRWIFSGGSPFVRQDIVQSFQEEGAMILKLIAVISAALRLAALALTYTVRGCIGLLWIMSAPLVLPVYLITAETLRKGVSSWWMNFHHIDFNEWRIPGLGSLRTWYAKISRDIDTSDKKDALMQSTENVLKVLGFNITEEGDLVEDGPAVLSVTGGACVLPSMISSVSASSSSSRSTIQLI